MTPKLSLIIPIFNETRRLEKGLDHALSYLQTQSYPWEIIVVNDGSTDNTQKLASKILSSLASAPIYLLNIPKNFGKGHALRCGVEIATGDMIFFSDIDFSVSLTHLPAFISALQTADIAIASRRLSDSKVTKHQPTIRESLGRGFTVFSNFILGLHHTDLTCGFKGFKKNVAKNIFKLGRLNGWAFDSEILFIAHKQLRNVKEIAVTWRNDPLTKVRLGLDVFQSLISLIVIRFHDICHRYKSHET